MPARSSRRPRVRLFHPAAALVLSLAACAGTGFATSDKLTGLAAALPHIVTDVSPAAGSLTGGETITISGSALEGVKRVLFGASDSPLITVINDSTVHAVVPHSYTYRPGPVTLTVLDASGFPGLDSSAALSYDYQVVTATDQQLQYAFEHWNNYNLAQYGDFTDWGGDCMNFVSQTLVARGWATSVDWYNDAQQDWAPAFVAVPEFDEWLSEHPELGAVRHTLVDRAQLKIGDIVMFDWDNDGSLDHAQIVSGIEVVEGKQHVYLVGHDIDTHYRDLDEALVTEGGPNATAFFWSLPGS
jgi:hypothetical protein